MSWKKENILNISSFQFAGERKWERLYFIKNKTTI